MKSVLMHCPGLNRERDMIAALHSVTGHQPELIWHTETQLPKTDLVVIPGGFSYGDYLRCGAIAARSPIMSAIADHVKRGGYLLGVCNGFQILTEAGFLPGALMRNIGLKFVCREVRLKIENNQTFFTRNAVQNAVISCPVAHHDGNYFADSDTLAKLEDNNQVVFRYVENTNPNGACNDIAGICDQTGKVIGMMPHPENMIEDIHNNTDCRVLFESLLAA